MAAEIVHATVYIPPIYTGAALVKLPDGKTVTAQGLSHLADHKIGDEVKLSFTNGKGSIPLYQAFVEG